MITGKRYKVMEVYNREGEKHYLIKNIRTNSTMVIDEERARELYKEGQLDY